MIPDHDAASSEHLPQAFLAGKDCYSFLLKICLIRTDLYYTESSVEDGVKMIAVQVLKERLPILEDPAPNEVKQEVLETC